jgi:hypothetical protein
MLAVSVLLILLEFCVMCFVFVCVLILIMHVFLDFLFLNALFVFFHQFESRSDEVYSIQHYVIKFVSDLRQVGGFL